MLKSPASQAVAGLLTRGELRWLERYRLGRAAASWCAAMAHARRGIDNLLPELSAPSNGYG